MPNFADLLITHGSYLSIFFVLVLTGSGLPIPEEVPIVLAGYYSADGTLNPYLAFMWCVLGAIVGDCVMYVIGYHFGRPVLRDHRWFARFVTPQREIQIEHQFRQHGFKVFFIARFLVGLRTPVYLTAGILRVSFRRFFFIDLFCASIVVGTFFWLSYFFGKTIVKWIERAEVTLTVAVVLALAGLGVYLWRRHKRKSAAAEPDAYDDEPIDSTESNSSLPHNFKPRSADISPQPDKAGK